jgi:hypothetical protein
MKTNREKYDYYCGIIDRMDEEAIAGLLPGAMPSQFFTISQYEAKPVAVTGVERGFRRGFYRKDPPTRIMLADVELAKKIAEEWAAPTMDDIYVFYSEKGQYGTASGAHPYSKIGSDPLLAWTAEALAPEIERRRALYAPRDGHQPCAYCRKQTPEGEMVPHTIHYRDRGGLAKKVGQYCSAQCGGYDQMGHEG